MDIDALQKATDLRDDVAVAHAVKLWAKSGTQNFGWRHAPSKFHGLVAEVLLQRTTATAASKVYTAFVQRFPNAEAVADAHVDDILEVIRPLGIHSRAKIIKSLAQVVNSKYSGVPPADYDLLTDLPGVGDYVASAYLLIHWNERIPIADSNITRLVSRLLGKTVSLNEGKAFLSILVPLTGSREFSLALLDLAMTTCRPNPWMPRCENCPLSSHCSSSTQL
jgi:A/G-specific adenine glycosylase